MSINTIRTTKEVVLNVKEIEISLESKLDADKPEYQTIQLLPRGKYWIEGRQEYLLFDDTMFKELVDSFNDPAIPQMSLDKNHKREESYGSFQNMRITEKGLVADVKLNDTGKRLIKQEEYKYISPYFGSYVDTNKKAHKWNMSLVTLTNIPALGGLLPTLQSQIELEDKQKQPKQEGKHMNMVALEVGLQAEANETIVLEAVRALKSKVIALENDNAKIALERNATEKALSEVNAKIALENEERNKKNAEVIVLEAIKKGKIMPTQKDIYLKRYCRSDEERQEVELEFKMLSEKKEGSVSVPGTETEIKLTDKQMKAVKAHEIDTKDPIALENFLNELDGGE